jgi:casein kinase II subunit beta
VSRGPPFVNPNPHGGQKRAAGYIYVPRIYGLNSVKEQRVGHACNGSDCGLKVQKN